MKREGRYKDCVPTGRRQADEIIRLKEAGVRPLEIASGLGSGGRAAGIEQHGTGNGQASVGGVKPTLIGCRASARLVCHSCWGRASSTCHKPDTCCSPALVHHSRRSQGRIRTDMAADSRLAVDSSRPEGEHNRSAVG